MKKHKFEAFRENLPTEFAEWECRRIYRNQARPNQTIGGSALVINSAKPTVR